MREVHHPGSDWYGCPAYGVVKRANGDFVVEGCKKCEGGEKYFSCCGKEEESQGCSVKAAWRQEGKRAYIEGRWRSPKHGMLTITQYGKTVSVLCPAAHWSPTSGVVNPASLSLLSTLGILKRGADEEVNAIEFQSTVWTRVSPINKQEEAMRRVLCNFFHLHDRAKLVEVDGLVTQYDGRKQALRDSLVELYHGNRKALETLDELFNTAPKWWRCTSCHDIMNARVFKYCSVCGCENKHTRKTAVKRMDDVSPNFFYPDTYEMSYKEPTLEAEPAVPHPDELVHQLAPSLLSLGILSADVPGIMKSGWAKTTNPVPKKYVAARVGRAQGDRSSSDTLLRYGTFPSRPVLHTRFVCGDEVTFSRQGIPHKATVLFVIELNPVSYVIQFQDGTEKVTTAAELTRITKQQSERPPAMASHENGLPNWHPGSVHRKPPEPPQEPEEEEEVVSREESQEVPTPESELEVLWSEQDTDNEYERPISLRSRTPSATFSDYGGAKWICFDCEYRANPSEEKYCLACGKRRNVGNIRKGKEEPVHTSTPFLPVPLTSYIPPMESDAFQNSALRLHNDYRLTHHAPELAYDASLAVNAQKQAELCARLVGVSHGHNEGQGQNTFMSGGLGSYNAKQIIEIACQAWYQELAVYKKTPGLQGLQNGAGHFTQIVWEGSTHMGAGVAWSGSRVYVVVNYKPPGNDTADPIVLKNVHLEDEAPPS